MNCLFKRLVMNKQELRRRCLELRRIISNKKMKSREITNKIISLDKYIKAKLIAIYSSLEDEVYL